MLKSTFRNPQSAVRTQDVHSRLQAVAQRNPEWRPWLLLLEETLRALDEPAWTKAMPQLRTDRPVATPLLDGVELAVDGRRARSWVLRLVRTAATGEGPESTALAAVDLSRLDTFTLLEAAACQDHTRLQTLADRMGADSQALGAIAQLAVMPLLQACGRHLASQVPPTWSSGYCPVCGAWPTLAELRGLEHTRRLRCARCGGDWGGAWLRCPYCGEADHQRLGRLLPEGRDETHKVETCTACKGYIKTLTTLQGSPPHTVVLEDLATVDLDIVALERGYTRPERPGYAVKLRLVELPSRLRRNRLRAFFSRHS